MTTYKCIKCNTSWSMGPTRDMDYSHACPECLESGLLQVLEYCELYDVHKIVADLLNFEMPDD